MSHGELSGDDMRDFLWAKYVSAGNHALRMKNHQEAKIMFKSAMEKTEDLEMAHPQQITTLQLLSQSCLLAQDYPEAERVLRKLQLLLALKEGPGAATTLECLQALVMVLEKQAKYSEAAKVMHQLMQVHPRRNNRNGDPEYNAARRKFYELNSRAYRDIDNL